MDQLEEKLKSLRLREPSADLDRRVLSHKSRSRSRLRRPVPMWAAMAAAAAMALFGFAIGKAMDETPDPTTISRSMDQPAVQVHVIMDPASVVRLFDLTQNSPSFPPPGWTATKSSEKGV
jgi:hypothetical protein